MIDELLAAGTRWAWLVRLVGPRRVEVYEKGRAPRVVGPGESLTAPGVLRNAVPIEALFEGGAALELTLRNLLQREGYEDLDDVKRGGLARAVESLRGALEIPLVDERRAEMTRLDADGLAALVARIGVTRSWG